VAVCVSVGALTASLAVASDPVPPVLVVHAPTDNSATHAISATDLRFAEQQLSAVIDSPFRVETLRSLTACRP